MEFMRRFKNRKEAGLELAQKIYSLAQKGEFDLTNAVVIALPRGGLPVGYEVSKTLGVELDVFVVRKIGSPHQEELAVGAITEGGEVVVNEEIATSLGLNNLQVEELGQKKKDEIEQRINKFRPGRPGASVEGRTVILVDDGVATGATALAAIHLLQKKGAKKVMLALPVCPPSTKKKLEKEVDHFVALMTPRTFYAVGQWYLDFNQVSDDEVVNYLNEARRWSEAA